MKKDVKVVVQRNRERAEAGDKWAQTKLGMRYLEGDGVERNDVEAKRWLRLAAEQGSQPAAKALEGIGLRAPSAPAQTAEAEMERGLQLTFRGEHDEAAEAFRHCMEIDKADPAPAYNLACSYAMQGIVEWAVQNLTEAVERGMSYAELMQDPDMQPETLGRPNDCWLASVLSERRIALSMSTSNCVRLVSPLCVSALRVRLTPCVADRAQGRRLRGRRTSRRALPSGSSWPSRVPGAPGSRQ